MKIVTSIKMMRHIVHKHISSAKSVGFVPTMGAFHKGHESLMLSSVKDNNITVVSLFVNPIQFGKNEDLKSYPRDLNRDKKIAAKAGVDYLFVPSVEEMYPQPLRTFVQIDQMDDLLCGITRPGHFRGVATVVIKLLNIVQPNVMYLGQKDAQQVTVIQRMVSDFNIPVIIKVCPTIREVDGLAMSSRNAYLSPSERALAPRIYKALLIASKEINDGQRKSSKIISQIKKLISDGTNASIDYVSCVGLDTFRPVININSDVLIAVAVKFGKTRLIDNVIVKAK